MFKVEGLYNLIPNHHWIINRKRYYSSTWISWYSMVRRCTYPKEARYEEYKSKGIYFHSRWLDFTLFLEDMGERPNGHTIDRIDNNSHYYKENCRWASHKEQARNRSNNRLLDWGGETLCMVEWAEILEMPYLKLKQRIFRTGQLIRPSKDHKLTKLIKKETGYEF